MRSTTTVPSKKVYDLYGPSEDTTYSTYILRKKNAPQSIGRPISNTQIYILDQHQHAATDGGAGGVAYRGGWSWRERRYPESRGIDAGEVCRQPVPAGHPHV